MPACVRLGSDIDCLDACDATAWRQHGLGVRRQHQRMITAWQAMHQLMCTSMVTSVKMRRRTRKRLQALACLPMIWLFNSVGNARSLTRARSLSREYGYREGMWTTSNVLDYWRARILIKLAVSREAHIKKISDKLHHSPVHLQ